jgi:aspartyl-tRNA(Asn)/glutamyl-tRNA(Gln) amidotransferase subunit C
MQIQVTEELVRKVAKLSRLALSSEEETQLKEHFEKILDFVASFQHLETSEVDPTHFSSDAFGVVREDEVKESLRGADVLRNAPSSRPPHFLVPRIVGADDQGGA